MNITRLNRIGFMLVVLSSSACSDEVTTSDAAAGGVGGAAAMSSASQAAESASASSGEAATTGVGGSGGAPSTTAASSDAVTSSSSSSSSASTSSGGITACEQACGELFTCGLTNVGGKQLCPGFTDDPASKSAFFAFCVPECEAVFDFVYFVDPFSCPTTINIFKGLSSAHAAVCTMGPG